MQGLPVQIEELRSTPSAGSIGVAWLRKDGLRRKVSEQSPGQSSNNSFKPNLLRYTKAMAEKACHGFASTTQVGLTQALCGYWGRAVAASSFIKLMRASSAGFGEFRP